MSEEIPDWMAAADRMEALEALIAMRREDPAFREAYDRYPDDPTTAYAAGDQAALQARLREVERSRRWNGLQLLAQVLVVTGVGMMLHPPQWVGLSVLLAGVLLAFVFLIASPHPFKQGDNSKGEPTNE